MDVLELSPAECLEKFPLLNTAGVLAGFYVPTDGRVNPVDACMAYAKAARLKGATIVENAAVASVLTTLTAHATKKMACGVTLEDGRTVEATNVVNCAGMWARQLAEKSGVTVPNQAAEVSERASEREKGGPAPQERRKKGGGERR